MRCPIDPALFKRRLFSGNPPHAPHVYGWIIRLHRYTTDIEKAWLHAHGYEFSGGKWCRADRGRRAESERAIAWSLTQT